MAKKTSIVEIAPKKRNREESTRRILQAGLDVFSEVGYDVATTKMISRRAGLNESLIHRYFKSKSNLLVEVTHACFEALRNENPYPPAETPEEEIYRFLTNKLENDDRNQNFFRVIFSRILVDPEIRSNLRKHRGSPMDLFFQKRLSLLQKKGLIRSNVNIKELAASVLSQSLAMGFLERIFFEKTAESCKKQFRIFARNIAKGICTKN
ncbi:MAG: TetR/AcrR family transcriptional regulator [Candidatus Omnitrophota bacterium]